MKFKDKKDIPIQDGDILQGDNSVIYTVFLDKGVFMARTERYHKEDNSGNAYSEYPSPYYLKDFQLTSILIIGNRKKGINTFDLFSINGIGIFECVGRDEGLVWYCLNSHIEAISVDPMDKLILKEETT